MTTNLSNRDQIDIAINGSKQFHAKAASGQGDILPDIVTDAHQTMATQLLGLARLFDKAAGYVTSGYPAKVAVTHIASEAGVDPDYVLKLASSLDDLGELVLQELVLDTFNHKVREKTARAPPPSPRTNAAMQRLAQLGSLIKK